MTIRYQWPAKTAENHIITLEEMLNAGADAFDVSGIYFGHGTDNPWDEAVYLALHLLKLPMSVDQSVLSLPLDDLQVTEMIRLFERRINERIPASYLTGKAFFAGLEFSVNADVLVPRSPLGELIQQQFSPWLINHPRSILDLCTGSGCIGIAAAKAFPESSVDLSDISRAALIVAEHNILAHDLLDRVSCVEGDMFSGVEGKEYDLILCNPPYVDLEDLANMPEEYHAEPEIALGSGDDGLDFCRRFLREVPDYLSASGCIVVEVGNSGEALEKAFPTVPFTWIEFEYGGHGVFVMTARELFEHGEAFD
ncbi:MAG: 50S ribosomal protein L3 N(5)-glutamine methyltransferase [Cellvibrionaceae bacterium]